ncbi:hypothetical protein P3T76_003391 [Phytophthora citrophthora]|uniref:Uncharacterized protein n=1 Tax=Phytophthora citrophthora TaxID=4793 RepID=A0AAD9LPF4_9STRA|nr:hypothetical protein P3T76_003391 [Phytophthora citrophthora]
MAHNYNLQHLHKYDFAAVMDATTTEEKAAAWAMDVGLLENKILCPQCALPMKLNIKARHWRCCHKKKHEDEKEVQRSILMNSWFSKMKLNLSQALRLMFAWCMRAPQTQATHMAKASEKTVSEWYASCRVLCSKELLGREFKVLLCFCVVKM